MVEVDGPNPFPLVGGKIVIGRKFEFFSENAELAQAHATQLDSDPDFGTVTGGPPRFVRWAEEGSL